MCCLVSDVLGTTCKEISATWAVPVFQAWFELLAELRIRLEIHELLYVMKLEHRKESNSESADLTAVCTASAEGGSRVDSTVASPVSEMPREIWNYMTHAMKTLVPGLQGQVHTLTVRCQRGFKDLHRLPLRDRVVFDAAVDEEFPVGQKLAGTVLDLTVNYQNWKNTPYLYACLVGKELPLEWQQFGSFRATMELLLFTCAKVVLGDETLRKTCCKAFRAESCSFILAWQLHKLDFDSDGSVVAKLEGAGGRVDYHIVAECRIDGEVVYYDVGHIYHTTNWKPNTFHAEAPAPYCARGLVVCAKPLLVQGFRHAVAAAWLSLSGNAGHRDCCLAPREQKHPDDFASNSSDEDASAGAQSSP